MSKATRDGFGEALVELGKTDSRIVVLTADLTGSTRVQAFGEKFPDRFFNVGIQEQNMVSMSAGLALAGLIPFAATYGVFLGRAWDQIRISVCLSNLNVKLIGTHAGVTVGADGASAQALEDIAMLRALPNMMIVCPCDAEEAKKTTLAIAQYKGPSYLRLSREGFADLTTKDSPFEIGRANVLKEGKDATLVGCGPILHQVMLAARQLDDEGISAEVINCHTIKPLDQKTLLTSLRKTGALVTIEEHQVAGGMGSAIIEMLVQHETGIPVEMVGVRDSFGGSGTAQELLETYELSAPFIVRTAKRVLKRRL